MMGGKPAKIDNSGQWWCAWCGSSDFPDNRLHLSTCSSKCAAALNADDRRRRREAMRALEKTN
jgi:predicted nucleic acid-binding Zn ribbon protein